MSEEKYISLAEVRDLLAKESEERGECGIEFNPVQNSALMHAQTIARLDTEQAEELASKVAQLEFFQSKAVPEYVAYRVADILPKYPVDVRAIFSKERINLEDSDIKNIIDIVAEYL
ncbi:MAG: RNA polymerase [Candidatus Methanomethylophilaceae archaeon]